MVAEDQIVAGASTNRIAGCATEDQIKSRARCNVVSTTLVRIGRRDPVDVRRLVVVTGT